MRSIFLFLEKFCTIYLRITLDYVCGIFSLHYAKDKNRLAHNLQVHIILKVSVKKTTTKQPDFPTQYIFPSLPFFCTGFLFVFPMRTKSKAALYNFLVLIFSQSLPFLLGDSRDSSLGRSWESYVYGDQTKVNDVRESLPAGRGAPCRPPSTCPTNQGTQRKNILKTNSCSWKDGRMPPTLSAHTASSPGHNT